MAKRSPFDVDRYEVHDNLETMTTQVYDRYTRNRLMLDSQQAAQLYLARNNQAQQMLVQQYMNGALNPSLYGMYGGGRPAATETVKERLLRTNYERWRRRMLRIREKVWEKRLGKLANLGWYVACGWGGIIATMLSIKLIKWLFTMILG